MIGVPISPLMAGGLENIRPGHADDPATLKKVAAEFESLLLARMLRSMRESSSGGWLGEEEEDQSGTLMVEIAEQQFARALAAQGGLGLADLIVSGLEKKR